MPLNSKMPSFKQFNVLEGLNLNLKAKPENDTITKEEETQLGNTPEDFSQFLREKKINLEISHIKMKEELSD